MITFSIISHDQIKLCHEAINSVFTFFPEANIILTINTLENIDEFLMSDLYRNKISNISIIKNKKKLGFGANHNQAFKKVKTDFFCVCNPDIEIKSFSESILKKFKKDLAFISPAIIDRDGRYEDNLRVYPNLIAIVLRFLGSNQIGSVDYDAKNFDWISGVFLIFPRDKYFEIGGFNESFFMYYEDADLCRRFANKGYKFGVDKSCKIIHRARRNSRRKTNFFLMHFISSLRILFFMTFFKNKKKCGVFI